MFTDDDGDLLHLDFVVAVADTERFGYDVEMLGFLAEAGALVGVHDVLKDERRDVEGLAEPGDEFRVVEAGDVDPGDVAVGDTGADFVDAVGDGFLNVVGGVLNDPHRPSGYFLLSDENQGAGGRSLSFCPVF